MTGKPREFGRGVAPQEINDSRRARVPRQRTLSPRMAPIRRLSFLALPPWALIEISDSIPGE
jgi:hypothetical protein